ncbi:MAG: FtsX-like permease family protein, partial [Pseudomonadota bacterium]
MTLALRIAIRELQGGLKGFRIYLACIALGVFSIAAAGSVTAGFSRGLAQEFRTLLGGDAVFTAAQRRASGPERAWLEAQGAVSEVITLNVMGEANGKRRQVDIRAVDDRHPLIGVDVVFGVDRLPDALIRSGERWGIAATPSLLQDFDLQIGDEIALGNISAVIVARLDKEADGIGTPGAFGPEATIQIAALEDAGRLTDGQLFRASYRLLLPEGVVGDDVATRAEEEWGASGLRYRGPEDAIDGLERLLDMLNTFLSVIGIAALIAGGVGIAQASSAFLESRIPSIAAFKAIGAEAGTIRMAYLLQLGLLAVFGALIGVVLGAATPFLIAAFLGDRIPLPTVLQIYPFPLGRALLLGTLAAAIFVLPPLGRARATRPAVLFRTLGAEQRAKSPWTERLVSLAAAIALFVLAIVTGETPIVTAALLAGAALAWGAFLGLARIIRFLAKRASVLAEGLPRLMLSNLGGPGSLAVTIVPALGLGLALLVFVTTVQANILRQVNQTAAANLPSLFITQIPTQGVSEFDRLVADQGIDIEDPDAFRRTPLVIGRVVALKGEPLNPDTVAESEQWVVDGEIGLPYLAKQPPEAELVEGAWWAEDYSGPLLVSVEDDAARGLGVALGDTIGFRVFGRDVTATVTSLRTVDWGQFGANSAFILSPGTLEAANPPHIAIVKGTPEQDAEIVRALGRDFRDTVVFQTRDALAAAGRLLGNISIAITAAASIVLASGLMVLFGAFAAMARQRRGEAALLKTFGASRAHVLQLYAGEFGLAGAAATGLGALLGVAAAYPVVVQQFEV